MLLVAYTAHEMDGFFSDLRAALSEVDDPLARLDVYVSCHVAYVAGHRLAAGDPLRAVLSTDAYQALHQHVAALADTGWRCPRRWPPR